MTILLNNFNFLLGGADLRAFGIQRSTTVWPNQNTASYTVTVPGRHGALHPSKVTFDEPQWVGVFRIKPISVPGTEKAQAEINTRIARLQRLASTATTLTRILANPDRPEQAISQSTRCVFSSIEYGDMIAAHFQDLILTLLLPDVWFRDEIPIHDTLTPDGILPGLSGSTAPIIDPVITLPGPFSRVTVKGYDNTGFQWTGTVTEGRSLSVDIHTMTARINTSIMEPPMVLPSGKLELWPDTAGNIRMQVTYVGGKPKMAAAVTARRAYL